MSALDFWTWAAIAVLIVGALAIFGWFLFDVRKLLGPDADGGDADRDRYGPSGR